MSIYAWRHNSLKLDSKSSPVYNRTTLIEGVLHVEGKLNINDQGTHWFLYWKKVQKVTCYHLCDSCILWHPGSFTTSSSISQNNLWAALTCTFLPWFPRGSGKERINKTVLQPCPCPMLQSSLLYSGSRKKSWGMGCTGQQAWVVRTFYGTRCSFRSYFYLQSRTKRAWCSQSWAWNLHCCSSRILI